ncbi:MAG: hypothetical protein Q8S11_08515 [Daejeonella sp.]|uniref:hypothetical protein n=1 Tax=Daejeonella sp. TaxID=2805397 RepID=UPI0027370FB6|nr:hypothetical protein [Daejeonella sp.]MDP3468364.1 hypothetical protein [Daejeonella sp.]
MDIEFFCIFTEGMFTKSKILKVYSHFHLSMGTNLKYGIIAFLALFYFFGQTAHTQANENRIQRISSIHQTAFSSNTIHSPSHLPFETAHKDWLNEDKEEDENKLYWTSSFEPELYKSFRSDSFLSVLNLNHKQAKVPLFILYHAWRTFLS